MSVLPAIRCISVRVLLFAQLKDRVGADELRVSLPRGSTGQDLMRWLAHHHPKAQGVLAVSRLAVNCEYASRDHVFQEHDEIVIIPPVSGG